MANIFGDMPGWLILLLGICAWLAYLFASGKVDNAQTSPTKTIVLIRDILSIVVLVFIVFGVTQCTDLSTTADEFECIPAGPGIYGC